MQLQTHSAPQLGRTLLFFLPLAITSALMMASHSLISAGLARTINPVQSIAAYSVALNLAAIFEAPLIQARQMSLTLPRDRRSYGLIRRLSLTALLVSVGLELLIAFTPLGSLVFGRVLSVPGELLQQTIRNFWVLMLLPLVSGIRTFFQGVIIREKQTTSITVAMVIRIALMCALVYAFTRWGWVKGGYVGGVTLVTGVGLEMVFAIQKARRLLKQQHDRPEGEDGQPVTTPQIWRFYYPLAIAALMAASAKPFINAGLARGNDATLALAAYSVAWSFGWIIVSPVQTIHQVTIVFGRQPGGDRHVRRFALGFGTISSLVLLAIGFSPLGRMVLVNWIGVSEALLAPTLVNLQMMSILPMLFGWLEYATGTLLLAKSTRIISLGKIANLIGTMVAVTLMVATSGWWSMVIGPLSQIAGSMVEGVVLTTGWFLMRMHEHPPATKAPSAQVRA